MEYSDFVASVDNETPPHGLSPCLLAMWYDATDNWDRAHSIVQDIDSSEAAQIHAYLHREEGDVSNAGYWYRRAGKSLPETSLELEWEQIVRSLLEQVK